MEKPKIKGFTPESYELLLKYAQHLSSKLAVESNKLSGKDLGLFKADVKFAWKEAHDMAIVVSQNYASKAKNALNEVMLVI